MTGNPSTQILAEIRQVSRTYGSEARAVPAVQNASLTIHAGDRIALTGQSGSGKSTLLHIIAGLDNPTSGTIQWPALGGRDDLRPKAAAIMMQSPSLVPWLTIAENVALPLQLAGRSDAEAAELALQALKQFSLDDLAAKLPEEISGGQAQRVALVRATVNGPALLLADEPTGQVDHSTAKTLMDALFAWAGRSGAAIVIATHDLAIAERFPVRLSMDHGHLETTPGKRLQNTAERIVT